MKKEDMLPEPQGLSDVSQFHRLFNLPVESTPIIPAEKRCKLRVSLLKEELEELKEAIDDNDLVEIADALADLQYVLSGAILEFGMGNCFKEIFEEVQRSNMSKACKTMEVALATQAHYKKEKDTDSFIEEKEGEFLVYRKEDKKVLKSIEYSPADIKRILEAQKKPA